MVVVRFGVVEEGGTVSFQLSSNPGPGRNEKFVSRFYTFVLRCRLLVRCGSAEKKVECRCRVFPSCSDALFQVEDCEVLDASTRIGSLSSNMVRSTWKPFFRLFSSFSGRRADGRWIGGRCDGSWEKLQLGRTVGCAKCLNRRCKAPVHFRRQCLRSRPGASVLLDGSTAEVGSGARWGLFGQRSEKGFYGGRQVAQGFQ